MTSDTTKLTNLIAKLREQESARQDLDAHMDRLGTATFVIASIIKALREAGVTQAEIVSVLSSTADELRASLERGDA